MKWNLNPLCSTYIESRLKSFAVNFTPLFDIRKVRPHTQRTPGCLKNQLTKIIADKHHIAFIYSSSIGMHTKRRFEQIWSKAMLALLLVVIVMACPRGDEPMAFRFASAHFVVHAMSNKATPAEMEDLSLVAESLLQSISQFFGSERAPEDTIHIWMEGNEAGTPGPYVDEEGIHMYRYTQDEGGYVALLAHEMVHAFNMPWYNANVAPGWSTLMFLEEGLAEYVAQKVDSLKRGYPFYAYPEDVVAGSLVKRELLIPFDTLRKRHVEINLKCGLQTYTAKASWIRHLHEQYGKEALFKVVFPDQEPISDYIEQQIGMTYTELDLQWEEWVMERYNNIPDADNIANVYWLRVSWYDVCIKGEDF